MQNNAPSTLPEQSSPHDQSEAENTANQTSDQQYFQSIIYHRNSSSDGTLRILTEKQKLLQLRTDKFFLAEYADGHTEVRRKQIATPEHRVSLGRLSTDVFTFSPANTYLANFALSGNIHVWNIDSNDLNATYHGTLTDCGERCNPGFSTNELLIATRSGKDRPCVQIWSSKDCTLLHTIDTEDRVDSVAFSPSNAVLAVQLPNKIIFYSVPADGADFSQTEIINTISLEEIYRIAFSPCGKYLAILGKEALSIWNVEKSELECTLNHPDREKDIDKITFLADGQLLLVQISKSGMFSEEFKKPTRPALIWNLNQYLADKARTA